MKSSGCPREAAHSGSFTYDGTDLMDLPGLKAVAGKHDSEDMPEKVNALYRIFSMP